jgi:threonine dehydrogenase-like Zn-dependent dehydrogenase
MASVGTAQAAIFRGTERGFDIVEHDVPQPGPGQALLKIELTGICGTDAHIYDVGAPSAMALGHEISGRLVALGEGVDHDVTGRPIAEGDLIVPHPGATGGAYGFRGNALDGPPHFTGGFGQYLSLCYPNSRLFRVDADPHIAVLLEPFSVALHAVDRSHVRVGDTVVVQGTGAIGLFAIFLARKAGAIKVIAVGGPAGRLEAAAALGADVLIDIAGHPDGAERTELVRAETPGGLGADVVIECAGVKSAVAEGLDYTRRSGTFCEVGHFIDTGDITINPNKHLVLKDINLVAPYGSNVEHFTRSRAVLEKDGAILEKVVSHRIPLSRLDDAFAALLGRYHLDGRDAVKIAVDPWSL